MTSVNLFGFFLMMDPVYWILTIVLAIPSLWAAMRVKATFAKFSRVATSSQMSGAEAAEAVMRAAGVRGVTVEPHRGFLSDHYDPRAKALRLSPDVYAGRSISSVAVAAHEAGHAIQDATGYAPLALRSNLVPIVNLGSHMWSVIFFIGLLTSASGLMYVGIALFAAVVLFQLITLPTEFNASSRAKEQLLASGIVASGPEAAGVASVLNAAALTYVAAAVTAVIHLIYLVTLARRND